MFMNKRFINFQMYPKNGCMHLLEFILLFYVFFKTVPI